MGDANGTDAPEADTSPWERLGVIVRGIGVAAACALIPGQVLISITYVLGRKLFDLPITALQELEWHIFFALVYLSLGAALLADRHVRIDILRARLSGRARLRIEVVGFFLALLPFCLAVIYFGAEAAARSFATAERSAAALGLPDRWIVRAMVPLGGILLLGAGCVVTARNLRRLKRVGAGDA
jgi:TRAP-type mannitol/chloroaromatic compound transport system permease small subunit